MPVYQHPFITASAGQRSGHATQQNAAGGALEYFTPVNRPTDIQVQQMVNTLTSFNSGLNDVLYNPAINAYKTRLETLRDILVRRFPYSQPAPPQRSNIPGYTLFPQDPQNQVV